MIATTQYKITRHLTLALTLATLLLALGGCAATTQSNTALADSDNAEYESLVRDPRVQHRSYVFADTGDSIPYALFVPSSYRASQAAPLVVSLHGLGRSYDWLMSYEGLLDYAEEYGFVVVTPLGYTRRGWYGSRATPDPVTAIYSEQDVMNVIALVREELNINASRLYLWGHSMGGAGTYQIAVNNPGMFAALAVVAPAPRADLSPTVLHAVRNTPILVMHGTADEQVPVELTRRWVAGMRGMGMPHIYVELPGADHTTFIAQNKNNMRKVMNFFDMVGEQPLIR